MWQSPLRGGYVCGSFLKWLMLARARLDYAELSSTNYLFPLRVAFGQFVSTHMPWRTRKKTSHEWALCRFSSRVTAKSKGWVPITGIWQAADGLVLWKQMLPRFFTVFKSLQRRIWILLQEICQKVMFLVLSLNSSKAKWFHHFCHLKKCLS